MLQYKKTIGFNSNQPIGRGFNYPYDIDFSLDGRIFLINRMSGLSTRGIRIQIFTFDEEWLGEFSSGPGRGDDQFVTPVCLAISDEDQVYITDESLNEVKIFDNQGGFLRKWGSDYLQGPAGIVHKRDGTLLLVEQYANRISSFTGEGKLISSWGEGGSKNGQFNLPWGLTIDTEGMVYVADWRNDRIQKFSGDGEFINSYGQSGEGPGQFHRPTSVAVGSDGAIYVADWGNERVQVLNNNGEFQQMLYGEATLSKWAEEWLEVNPDEYDLRKESDLSVDNLPGHLKNAYHTASQTEPVFWGPVSVKVDGKDRLYVTEHSRHRIQVYESL